MTTQHAKSNAREGDGVAEHVARALMYADSNAYSIGHYLDLANVAIAAMQAQQGAEPVAQAAAFGGLKLGHGFLVTAAELPSGAVYDLVPRGTVTAPANGAHR